VQATSDLTTEQAEQLAAWRGLALTIMPYMAAMLFSLRPVSAPGLGTFAVDKHHRLYIDFQEVSAKGPRWCAEGLLHECCHLLGDHAARAEAFGVKPEETRTWNIAADCSINDDLRDAGCATIAQDGVLPKHFGLDDDQTAEFYMRNLPGRLPRQMQGEQGGGCGSGSGAAPEACEIEGAEASGPVAAGASQSEAERARIATAAHISQQAGKNPGSVPGGLVEMANTVLAPPKIPWRQVLAAYLRRYVAVAAGNTDTTYLRRRRRLPSLSLSSGGRVVMPGSISPKLSLAVVRDTSGSMGEDELAAVMSEIEGIARQAGVSGPDLIVLDTDTEVAAKRGYHGAASIADVHGRGGTDMGAGIAAAGQLKPRPLAAIVLTDGYTPWPDERPAIPVIVCLVGDGAQAVASEVPKWAATVVAT
jgi:predicted metal-dependent peptidase